MAWVNADYMSQATDVLRLASARLHHAELQLSLSAEVGTDGYSRSTKEINLALVRVEAFIMRLDKRVAATAGGATAYIRNAGPR